MKFRLYREYGALNSKPVFDSLEKGLRRCGHEIVESNEDVSVIWSVLWQGRMKQNQKIYQQCRKNNKPIMILEVGNLKRGETWRLSLDHINNSGIFANDNDLDPNRSNKLSVRLQPVKSDRKKEILIAAQHQHSLQWENMPSMVDWCKSIVSQIKKHCDYKIVVRPHPRSHFTFDFSNVYFEKPKKILSTYDDFDISYDFHCVINHNSGPAVQAAINGTPIVCDPTSLAYEVSDKMENIQSISLMDREHWFLKLCHTEWTLRELELGIPIERLIRKIQ
jgi:hypothetical protein